VSYSDVAQSIAAKIREDLDDRRGVWESVDDDTKDEIVDRWMTIIDRELVNHATGQVKDDSPIDFSATPSWKVNFAKGPTVIIEDDDGPEHHNQTNGISCSQEYMKGYAFSLDFLSSRDQDTLTPCLCDTRLDKEAMQEVFDRNKLPIKVTDGYHSEAWIKLNVKVNGKNRDAVLTYNNCD